MESCYGGSELYYNMPKLVCSGEWLNKSVYKEMHKALGSCRCTMRTIR